jgi:hypothetical protein
MWDMTNNKTKLMKYLQNTEDNKTHTTRSLPPPEYARRWYIIKFFLWEISNIGHRGKSQQTVCKNMPME